MIEDIEAKEAAELADRNEKRIEAQRKHENWCRRKDDMMIKMPPASTIAGKKAVKWVPPPFVTGNKIDAVLVSEWMFLTMIISFYILNVGTGSVTPVRPKKTSIYSR